MVKVALVGAGNIKYHYSELLGLSESGIDSYLGGIAKALCDSGSEIVSTPDSGVAFDVAKRYKSLGGKKVIALAPISDKRWGTKHIDSYLREKVNGKKVVDEVIDTLNWLEHDSTHNLFGDVSLCLGITLGSLREICGAYYVYKLFGGHKPEAKIASEKVHPQIIAGKRMPFHIIVFSPFCKEKFPFEIEKYIEKLDCKIFYVKNVKELKGLLESFPKTP